METDLRDGRNKSAQGRVIFHNTCLLLSSALRGVLLQPCIWGAWLGCQKKQRESLFYEPSLLPFYAVRNFPLRISHKFLLKTLHSSESDPSQLGFSHISKWSSWSPFHSLFFRASNTSDQRPVEEQLSQVRTNYHHHPFWLEGKVYCGFYVAMDF